MAPHLTATALSETPPMNPDTFRAFAVFVGNLGLQFPCTTRTFTLAVPGGTGPIPGAPCRTVRDWRAENDETENYVYAIVLPAKS